jgi:hypothetical protein
MLMKTFLLLLLPFPGSLRLSEYNHFQKDKSYFVWLSQFPKFASMKKLILVLLAIILLASCNQAVCPAYSDAANSMKNTIFQKGNHRADGINRVYRDSYQKKLR